MKQYIDLLKTIREHGTQKPGARPGMPGSLSLFGHQFRHDLAEGFPALTTKKLAWKSVVVELLWFLRGDTNIKYLVDNGCNIWNQDAYNYYMKKYVLSDWQHNKLSFEEFVRVVKTNHNNLTINGVDDYKIGDCGHQYGKVWRDWRASEKTARGNRTTHVDQLVGVLNTLKFQPESRRHIVTAVDPIHQNDLALYWCHAMFQFNCRPLTQEQQQVWIDKEFEGKEVKPTLDHPVVPKYYLDCQLYQRSADVVLGVPFNIASYALLTHILAKICNMVPGHFIHTFGDVHIYDNHQDAVDTQLDRAPTELPRLEMFQPPFDNLESGAFGFDEFIKVLRPEDFTLENYNPQPAIKAELSTGLIK